MTNDTWAIGMFVGSIILIVIVFFVIAYLWAGRTRTPARQDAEPVPDILISCEAMMEMIMVEHRLHDRLWNIAETNAKTRGNTTVTRGKTSWLVDVEDVKAAGQLLEDEIDECDWGFIE